MDRDELQPSGVLEVRCSGLRVFGFSLSDLQRPGWKGPENFGILPAIVLGNVVDSSRGLGAQKRSHKRAPLSDPKVIPWVVSCESSERAGKGNKQQCYREGWG